MNQLKVGAILNYVIIALNTVVGLAYTPYMLRCLGQNEYGLYSLVSSVIAYLTLLDFGFGNAIIRYTAKFRAEDKLQKQWEMFGMFLIVYSLIGIIAFCGGVALYFNVDYLFDNTMTNAELGQARIMMLLLTINLAITFPLSIFGSIITAYENFIFQRLISIVRIIISTGVLVLVLALGFKAVALVVVQTIFNILVLLINVIYCRRKLRIKIVFNKIDVPFLKEISVYSFWIFLNAIMDKIYWGSGQFVLGAISGTTAVAIFSVAIMLQQMYMQFSTSIANVLLPKLTAMTAKKNSEVEISDLFIRTGRLQFIVMFLILAGFIIFGKEFIIAWAGNDYLLSYYVALIFFVALFVPLIQNTGIAILQARNQMKFRSLLYLSISIISLIFQFFLSRQMGVIGCAIAIGVALIIGQGIVMNWYYQKRQHIDILKFWKQIGSMLIPPATLTILASFISRSIDLSNLIKLIVGILVFVGCYIFVIWKLCMNINERQLILSPFKRIMRK